MKCRRCHENIGTEEVLALCRRIQTRLKQPHSYALLLSDSWNRHSGKVVCRKNVTMDSSGGPNHSVKNARKSSDRYAPLSALSATSRKSSSLRARTRPNGSYVKWRSRTIRLPELSLRALKQQGGEAAGGRRLRVGCLRRPRAGDAIERGIEDGRLIVPVGVHVNRGRWRRYRRVCPRRQL